MYPTEIEQIQCIYFVYSISRNGYSRFAVIKRSSLCTETQHPELNILDEQTHTQTNKQTNKCKACVVNDRHNGRFFVMEHFILCHVR